MNYSDMKFGYFGVLLFEQVHDLGLEKSILAVPSSHPAARSRFIYSRRKLHQLPSGVISIIKRQSLFSKSLLPTILREPFLRGKQDNGDESVYNFFKRRMNEEVCTGRLLARIRKVAVQHLISSRRPHPARGLGACPSENFENLTVHRMAGRPPG